MLDQFEVNVDFNPQMMQVSFIAMGNMAQMRVNSAEQEILGFIKKTKFDTKVIKFSKYHPSETTGKTIAYNLRKNKEFITKLESDFKAKLTITDV